MFVKMGGGMGRMWVGMEWGLVGDGESVGVVGGEMGRGVCDGREGGYMGVGGDVIVIRWGGEGGGEVVCCEVMLGVGRVRGGRGRVDEDEVGKCEVS